MRRWKAWLCCALLLFAGCRSIRAEDALQVLVFAAVIAGAVFSDEVHVNLCPRCEHDPCGCAGYCADCFHYPCTCH